MNIIAKIKKYLTHPPKTITTEYFEIGPEEATFILTLNTNNRPMTERRVLEHVRSLLRGEQKTTHQGIAISKDGVLLDGQKRCEAIRRTGKSWTLGVTFGLDNDVFDAIDKVQARKLCDTLQRMRGTKNAAMRVAALRVTAHLAVGNQISIASESDFDAWYDLYGKGLDFSTNAFVSQDSRPSQIVGAIAFAYNANPTELEKFAEQIIKGEELKARDPALVLRNAIGHLSKRIAGGNNDPTLAKATLNAAVAFLSKEKMQRINTSASGWTHFKDIVVTPKVRAVAESWKKFEVRAVPRSKNKEGSL